MGRAGEIILLCILLWIATVSSQRQTCIYGLGGAFCMQDTAKNAPPTKEQITCMFGNVTSSWYTTAPTLRSDCPQYLGIAASTAVNTGFSMFCCQGSTCELAPSGSCTGNNVLVICLPGGLITGNRCPSVGICVPALGFQDTSSVCAAKINLEFCYVGQTNCQTGSPNVEPARVRIPGVLSDEAGSSSSALLLISTTLRPNSPTSTIKDELTSIPNKSSPSVSASQSIGSNGNSGTVITQPESSCGVGCIAGVVSASAAALSAMIAAITLLRKRNRNRNQQAAKERNERISEQQYETSSQISWDTRNSVLGKGEGEELLESGSMRVSENGRLRR
ncbi:hypothetical protein HK098_006594 [Nowakowskiella sp. JEL0407]|nr:hypothetical protein HK098_006594 [Nowakowskiella sp. JEL0407]